MFDTLKSLEHFTLLVIRSLKFLRFEKQQGDSPVDGQNWPVSSWTRQQDGLFNHDK